MDKFSSGKTRILGVGENALIQCAPNMILVNGYYVAKNYKDFVRWCAANDVKQSQFKNWPFIENLPA